MREYVDFHYVEPKHRAIDERLHNWARVIAVRGATWTHPMWRNVKPCQVWAQEVRSAPDSLDGMHVEKGIRFLPVKPCESVRWAYYYCHHYRVNPTRMCRLLGVTPMALAEHIRDGRQMLINRGL